MSQENKYNFTNPGSFDTYKCFIFIYREQLNPKEGST